NAHAPVGIRGGEGVGVRAHLAVVTGAVHQQRPLVGLDVDVGVRRGQAIAGELGVDQSEAPALDSGTVVVRYHRIREVATTLDEHRVAVGDARIGTGIVVGDEIDRPHARAPDSHVVAGDENVGEGE